MFILDLHKMKSSMFANLLEIFPRLFGHLRVSYVAKHVVVYTCFQAIQYAACGLRFALMSRIRGSLGRVGLRALI